MASLGIDESTFNRMKCFVWTLGFDVGMFFGLIVSFAYNVNFSQLAGLLLGALSGLAAGAIWTRQMFYAVRQSIARDKLNAIFTVLMGVVYGLCVGVLATIILHVGLMFVKFNLGGRDADVLLDVEIIFGATAGAITGLVCGLAWLWPTHAAICKRRDANGTQVAQSN